MSWPYIFGMSIVGGAFFVLLLWLVYLAGYNAGEKGRRRS